MLKNKKFLIKSLFFKFSSCIESLFGSLKTYLIYALLSIKLRFLVIITFVFVWILLVQATFFYFQQNQAQRVSSVILAMFNQSVTTRYHQYIAENLGNLESEGVIACPTIIDESGRILLDLSFKGKCSPNEWLLEGFPISREFITVSGAKWTISMVALNSRSFFIGLWISRIGGLVILCLVGVILSLQKSLWEERRQNEMQLVTLSRQVAHDIRAPVAALNSVEKILRDRPKEALSLLGMSIRRINDIAEELLFKSRKHPSVADSGEIKTEVIERKRQKTQFNCSEAINEILKEKKYALGTDSGIRFLTDIHDSVCLFGNRSSFQRAISNILQNSIDAIENEGFISLALEDMADEIRIEIRDSGRGISEENLDILNTSPKTVGKRYGNGLGLSFSKEVVKSFGGRLFIFSELGVGTTVKISIPQDV